MVQLSIATLVALLLLGIFGQARDSVIKRSIGRILLWTLAGAIIFPLALWLFVNLGPFLLLVLTLFIIFRWLLSPSAPEN